MKSNVPNRGSTPATSATSATDLTSQDPRGRTFYECPNCACRFLSETDLMYHLWTHVKPKKPKKVKVILTRKQNLRKYRRKLEAYRANYGETGLCLARKGSVKIQYTEDLRDWSVEDGVEPISTGEPRSLKFQIQKVLKVIGALEKASGVVQDEDLFFAMLEDHGVARSETARLIGVITRDGAIYSPKPGYYRCTRGGG